MPIKTQKRAKRVVRATRRTPSDNLEKLTLAVVKVGDGGRGFVIEGKDRIVITAAHCLVADDRPFPPPHPWSCTAERTYPHLLGPLGKAKSKVWAECLFADPIADIAVLGSPDNQELSDEAEAYEQLMRTVPRPFPIAEAPKQGIKRIKIPREEAEAYEHMMRNLALPQSGKRKQGIKRIKAPRFFETSVPGRGSALLLTLGGKWIEHAVGRRGPWLWIDDQKHIEGGMSGSPIISPDGKAIGLVSTGNLNPILLEALPPRIGLRKACR
jgi:hypothetical protein